MKRIIFSLCFVSMLLTVSAQQDTVQYADPWYMFNPLSANTSYNPYWDREPIVINSLVQRFQNSAANDKIYGVAVVMDTIVPDKPYVDPPYFYVLVLDSLDSYKIYFGGGVPPYDTSDYYPCLDVQARDSATFDSYTRRCFLKYQYNYEDAVYSLGERTFPCYEFFFDTPYITTQGNGVFVGQHYVIDENDWWIVNRFLKVTDANNVYFKTNLGANLGGIHYWLPHEGTHIPLNEFFSDNWGGIFPIVRLRCTLPRMVHETGRGSDHLSFAWQDHDDATGFQVAIYPAGTPEDSIVPIDATGTSHTFTGLTPGVNYLYSVRKLCHYATNSYDTVVTSDWFPPQQFYIASSDGIADIEAPRFSLSPNPAGESVTVTLEEPATGCRLELYDAAGRRVYVLDLSPAATAATLDLKGLAVGVYLVRLSTPAGTTVKKLLLR